MQNDSSVLTLNHQILTGTGFILTLTDLILLVPKFTHVHVVINIDLLKSESEFLQPIKVVLISDLLVI